MGLALVLLTGLTATCAATLYVDDLAGREQEERFTRISADVVDGIRVRMEAYVATLRATRGLFAEGREPSRRAFAEFVHGLELQQRYPGIRGIGFAKTIRPADLAAHEARVRAEGFPSYRVWPEGERDPYTAIVFLEPFDEMNRRAFGYDMLSEPTRAQAMVRARDQGEPAATGKVELVQESGAQRQPGFLVYVPIYSHPAASPEERRERLAGWVYAPFRAHDLLRGTLGDAASPLEITLEVFDGAQPVEAARLYGGASKAPVVRTRVVPVDVVGHTWTLRFNAGPAFSHGWERWLAPGVFVLGLGLTALLLWSVRAEIRARDRAEEAARRAAFLADSGRILASSLDYARNLEEVARLAAHGVADGCVVHLAEPGAPPRWIAGDRDGALGARAVEALRAGRLAPGDGGIADALTVPLSVRGELLGDITLLSAERGDRFDRDDLALAEDFARLAVAAIDSGRLYRNAQQSLQLRDEFLSIASHELRTPLTSLGLQAESLRARSERDPPAVIARKAEAIRRNVDRLGRLVSALLDLSRITAGRLELELETLDLAELAREVAGRFDEEARRVGSVLRVDAPDPVPGCWDRLRLDQVLTNLLANALKYGAGRPVELSVSGVGDRAVVTVRDHGIGIAPDDQQRIFERFERAVSERNYGGFGLGLWIVRQIVEALGGSISVASTPGEGSTFTVELRREPECAAGGRDEPGAAGERPATTVALRS